MEIQRADVTEVTAQGFTGKFEWSAYYRSLFAATCDAIQTLDLNRTNKTIHV